MYSSFWFELGIVHCTYIGVSDYNLKKKKLYSFVCRSFTLTNSVELDEMQHFTWIFTDCKSTRLGVSGIQRVN